MKCPHCLVEIHPDYKQHGFGSDKNYQWILLYLQCPSCVRYVIFLEGRNQERPKQVLLKQLAYPKGISRTPVPEDVPDEFASDYKEACLVLADSPKASAALSRRCLQSIIREKARIKKPNLSQEIDEILKSKQLPSYLADAVDAVRSIGNFAAHPIKDTNTGEIVKVEPGEAEWLLDVLEGLFDYYFVQPAQLERKREALNQKLAAAGKPPMK